MKQTLWSRNYTLVTVATVLGCIGGVAGGFALSFLVYDETGSTLAAAILIAIQVIPNFIIPLLVAPIMDRLPRKPFLVGGDLINGALYLVAGLYLIRYGFSYVGYLLFSLLLASIQSFDQLAYTSIFPKLIPAGFEDKGYTVSAMVYPVLQVIMMPVMAILYEAIGVGMILVIQSGLSIAAAIIESFIRVQESSSMQGERFSLRMWWNDQKDAIAYLKKERGLRSIYAYMAVTQGIAIGGSPILIAFFRTAPGFTIAMYSFFAVAEFAGRSLGGLLRYIVKIPEKRRFSFAFFVYQTYDLMDAILLWLPYPLMLVNRAICGFLGINSATLRQTAVQNYIPESHRARLNAFENVLYTAAGGVLTLIIGALGEVLDYRWCMTIGGLLAVVVCLAVIWRNRVHVRGVYNRPGRPPEPEIAAEPEAVSGNAG